MYVYQLSDSQKLSVYKQVKAILIECDALTVENLRNALDSKLSDLEGVTL